MVIRAPGTTPPEGSRMEPAMVPEMSWVNAGKAHRMPMRVNTRKVLFIDSRCSVTHTIAFPRPHVKPRNELQPHALRHFIALARGTPAARSLERRDFFRYFFE